ncbi:hypothetical protein CesoFtcFv8_007787 [Champsocephalus esox]|uniref:Rhodanese domain-containing protein n=1 Tax=Champsocephalus esox TaxID=159716 RepID=A0AAN8H7M6_9TELE|nr:hypothetical protein CesoFtcFv8_007787 [Champsocephalus esox]
MAGEKGPTKRSAMDIKRLASLIQRGTGRLLVIDSRTFSEYNASHVQGAVNVCCSKLVKRRLQQDKVSVTELLQPNGKVKVELGRKQEVVVYDQSSKEAGHLSKDGFVHILMGKLESTFHKVSLLTGTAECVEYWCENGIVVCFFIYTKDMGRCASPQHLCLTSVQLFVLPLFGQQMALMSKTTVLTLIS